MNKEKLLEEVLPYLVTYVQNGLLNIAPLLRELPQIERVADLVKLYVLKQQYIIAFMRHYPALIRESAAATKKQQYTTNEVRGDVLWQETIRQQLAHSTQQFVVSETRKQTEAIEQQVVSYVASSLVQWYRDDVFIQRFHTRSWLHEVNEVMPSFMRAVRHLHAPKPAVTPRVIARMQQHRKRLYREAARIYTQLDALEQQRYDDDVLKQALREFFVVPEQEETLFELYWIVQILKQQRVKLYINEGKTRPLARWQLGDTTATLYHNKTGSSRVSFATHIDDIQGEHAFLKHTTALYTQYNEAAAALFHRPHSPYIWRGRPDFLVEYVCHDTLTHLVVGEVKYTSNVRYMQQGLHELLHYMHYVTTDDAPIISGVLCVNDYPPQKIGNIQIVSARAYTSIQLPKLEE